jgi:hypothetical protein
MKDNETITPTVAMSVEIQSRLAGSAKRGQPLNDEETAFVLEVLRVAHYRIRHAHSERVENDPHFRLAFDSVNGARDFIRGLRRMLPLVLRR